MKKFAGFPAKMQFTPLPNLFFSAILPDISDIAELKTTLHIFSSLYVKRGYPRFVTYQELLHNQSLMSSLGDRAEESLRHALEMALQRGTILHIRLDRDGAAEDLYFLNSESDRQVVARIDNGELTLPGLKTGGPAYADIETKPQPNIFALYEENIGILTPMIADELREAEKLYPEGWMRDAIKEAVNQNIRKKSYILAMLERWATEGKTDGAYQRDFKKADPDKYIKGKYGHIVRR
ncbi:MAG: DnaD domain protein [Chloroflexi bacterium]|nr:DnaD domain protein [Chloroflexota bacterium]